MSAPEANPANPPADRNWTEADRRNLARIYQALRADPAASFTAEEIADAHGLDRQATADYLEYLCDLERETENPPALRGIARVLYPAGTRYEPLSDNPDVRRDYDFRATNNGGRDFCPKNMFYYLWAWIEMLEERRRNLGLPENRVVLITNDCRYYPEEILAAAVRAVQMRGYSVVFARTAGGHPSCVSSYSHAVRMARPAMAVFITASHVSRPLENLVIGAKVSMLGATGRLESLNTREIKQTTERHLRALKSRVDLHLLRATPATPYTDLDVSESHTRMAVVSTLASLGRIPGVTLFDLAGRLRDTTDIDAVIGLLRPSVVPDVFRGLRIVVDGSHTASGPLAQRAFLELGATTPLLHGEVRSVRGPHTADPSVLLNLRPLFKEMKDSHAHMGMAFDLDGDRGAIVLPNSAGHFVVLAPDKLGQVLIPFLMAAGGYGKASKPVYVRDCLSTDALVEQGRLSGVAIETTDAGYVFLKRRETDVTNRGCSVIGMGEASGHAWLDVTGPFENPVVLALLFTAMCVEQLKSGGHPTGSLPPPTEAFTRLFESLAIPYRKSARFQALFAPALVAEAAADPRNDTGWSPASGGAIPQKIIGLCRSASIRRLAAHFTTDWSQDTPVGRLTVAQFETQWDEEEEIFRFGKIHFHLDGLPAGSFVTRGSSNDPTAVQVWEVKEFDGARWQGERLTEDVIQQRFHLIGGLVLSTCRDLGILELVDRPPAANLAGILPSVERYHALMSGAA